MSTYKRPGCGGQDFQITVSQVADVTFDEQGEHKITDGPYGDIYWDDDSWIICNNIHCRWSDHLRDAKTGD